MPLSQKQMEYLALAWQCFETEPKIDYEKFRQVAGLKTAHSARELMRVTKNKLKTEYGALSGGVQTANSQAGKQGSTLTPNGKKTPVGSPAGVRKAESGRKRTAAAAASAVDADDGFVTNGDQHRDVVFAAPPPVEAKRARTEEVVVIKREPTQEPTPEDDESDGYF